MDLTFGQKVRLGLGALALLRKHAELVPQLRVVAKDIIDLWDDVVPSTTTADKPIHEVISEHLTPDERVQFARAGGPGTG